MEEKRVKYIRAIPLEWLKSYCENYHMKFQKNY